MYKELQQFVSGASREAESMTYMYIVHVYTHIYNI